MCAADLACAFAGNGMGLRCQACGGMDQACCGGQNATCAAGLTCRFGGGTGRRCRPPAMGGGGTPDASPGN